MRQKKPVPASFLSFTSTILQRGATDKFPQDMMLFKAVVNNIANAQLAGEIGNMQSPEDVAYALYHTLRSVAYTWCSSGGNDSLMDEYKHAFQSVCRSCCHLIRHLEQMRKSRQHL